MLPDRSSSITRAVRELQVTPSQVQQSVPPLHEGKEVPFGWLMESLSSKRALFSFSKHPKPPHNNSWKPKTKTQKQRTCGHSIEIMLRLLSFPTLDKWYAIYKLLNRCSSRASQVPLYNQHAIVYFITNQLNAGAFFSPAFTVGKMSARRLLLKWWSVAGILVPH